MARFPTTEAEIVALCQQMIAGLPSSSFTGSAVTAGDLQSQLEKFVNARGEAATAEAAAMVKTGAKNNELEILTDKMKTLLRDAENIAKGDNAQLNQIGWGARAQATALQPPEQPRNLESPQQGDGWVFLDWKEPIGGGAVAFYKLQRRELPDGAWEDAGSAIPSEYTLINQPRGKQLEYRVISVNRAGESQPSNAAEVVL